MATWEIVLRVVAGLALLVGNAFFVVTEFALTRLSAFDRADVAGDPRLERAYAMLDRLEIYLTGCQVGITICSIGLGVVAEPGFAALFGGLLPDGSATSHAISVGLGFLLLNLLHIIIGEQTPTYLGVERARRVARVCAPIHRRWTQLMRPVIAASDWAAKALLRLVGVEMSRSWVHRENGDDGDEGGDRLGPGAVRREMGQILARAGVPADRRREVVRAYDLGERPVAEIMVRRDRLTTLGDARPLDDNLALMGATLHARYPVERAADGALVGVLYVPELFRHVAGLRRGDLDLAALAHDTVSVPATLSISDAIDAMQAADGEAAFVVDGDDVVGWVTITNALEAVVGDLRDPLDVAVEGAAGTAPASTGPATPSGAARPRAAPAQEDPS
ncbi:MAG: DUF21 domain-containing protein [Myxococcales bacterium]|nr:DUF21 domain-containing protein [Myxococcales bacterium]